MQEKSVFQNIFPVAANNLFRMRRLMQLCPLHTLIHIAFNLLQPTGYVMHQQFNIQQINVLRTLYLCVLCLSENKQRLLPLTA